MNVLVCGGRDYSDYALFCWHMHEIGKGGIKSVIHGAAPGADTLAGAWAKEHGVPVKAYPAAWNIHGRGAGPIRNQHMLDDGKPDLVIAFPGGRGTADMVRRANKAGIPVKEIT